MITIKLAFTVVFGIHFNFLIVLPIQLKTCRSKSFSHLQGEICGPEKLCQSEALRVKARLIDIRRAVSPGLCFLTYIKDF